MRVENQQNLTGDVRGHDSMALLGARLFWAMLGPMTLALLLMGIVSSGTGWLTGLDLSFFVVLAVMVGCRWMEQRSGRATTMDGEPTTWAHFRRWVVVLIPVAVAAWACANVVGNHLFHAG